MAQKQKQNLHLLLTILVLIGAINWGTIGVFNYNILHEVLLGNTIAKKVVYSLIGIAGLYLAIFHTTLFPQRGEALFPTHILYHCDPPSKGKKITIQTKYPNTSLVYWSVNEKDGSLVNTGTATTNQNGSTTVILSGPKDQQTEGYIILPREVYFRSVLDSGTLSKVESVKI